MLHSRKMECMDRKTEKRHWFRGVRARPVLRKSIPNMKMEDWCTSPKVNRSGILCLHEYVLVDGFLQPEYVVDGETFVHGAVRRPSSWRHCVMVAPERGVFSALMRTPATLRYRAPSRLRFQDNFRQVSQYCSRSFTCSCERPRPFVRTLSQNDVFRHR